MTMTKSDIQNYGMQQYINKTWKVMLAVGATLVAGVFISGAYSDFAAGVFMIALVATFLYWTFKGMSEGRKFWKSVKDKEEPIQL